MLFLIVLAAATLITAAVQGLRRRFDARSTARVGLGVAMAFAGVAHLAMPAPFLQHLPPWTPAAEAVIVLTGIIEIALGAALLLRHPWRRRAGLALAAYLVAVFPGNVYMAVEPGDVPRWLAIARLPLQVPLVLWALQVRRDA